MPCLRGGCPAHRVFRGGNLSAPSRPMSQRTRPTHIFNIRSPGCRPHRLFKRILRTIEQIHPVHSPPPQRLQQVSAMADAQRIYPANEDVEKSPPPTAPLAPKSSLASEKGDPAAQVLHVQVPKDQVFPARQAPRYHSRPPKRRRGFCCRCLTWTFCLALLLIVVIAVALGILYLVFQPRIPKYSVDSIQITNFSVSADLQSVSSQFAVDVRARNPNKKIGIYYLGGSYVAVFYSGTELCNGSIPAFYQGHKNTTNLNLTLTGTDVQITNNMITALTANQQEGRIPLRLKANVPVKIKFGKLKTMKITFRMRCNIVVNKLEANTNVNIISKKCKIRLKL